MSLFGSDSDSDEDTVVIPAGLYHFHQMISTTLCDTLSACLNSQFFTAASSATTPTTRANQVMLFATPSHPFPPFLQELSTLLSSLLLPLIPIPLHSLLFNSSRPQQAILNQYHPPAGISSHVDLISRFQDGIIGVSLESETIMTFTRTGYADYNILLQPGDVYILSGEARYLWYHGIATTRAIRMSITLRRLLEGGDIVGPA